jgi:ankyrin repeat protein
MGFGMKKLLALAVLCGSTGLLMAGEAVVEPSIDVARALDVLYRKYSLSLCDKNYGDTLLHCAVGWKRYEDCALLLNIYKDGNYINIKGGNGGTALHSAVGTCYLPIVQLLLAHDADVNAKDALGNSPLHLAVKNGSKELVELLLEHRADVNIRNFKGDTALHKARFGDMVEVLFTVPGIDVNIKNAEGYTPIDIAAMNNRGSVVSLLQERGAHISVEVQQELERREASRKRTTSRSSFVTGPWR